MKYQFITLKFRVALLTVIGFLCAGSSAWADNNSWIRKSAIMVNYSGSTDTKLILNSSDGDGCEGQSGSNFGGYDFGIVSKLYLKKFIGAGWYNGPSYWLDGNSFTGYYRVYRQGSSAPSWSNVSVNNYSCEHSDNHFKQWYSNNNINLISGLSAGNYYFEVALSMYEYWDGGSYQRMIPGNGTYSAATSGYNSTFTIPGFTNVTTSKSFTTAPGGNESKTISFNHYGTALTTSNCTISDPDKFEVTGITESDVTVKFKAPSTEGTYTATLTITDEHSKSSGTISLTGRSGYPLTVSIADVPVVSDGPQVELSGYLKYSGCDNTLFKRGFFYCEGSSCDVTTSSLKAEIDGETTLKAKDTFTKKFYQSDDGTALKASTTYCYKAYVYSGTTSTYTLSSETGKFTTGAACQFAVGDTIYYTVDNTQDEDPCQLRFNSLAHAIADMKKSHANTSGGSISAWMNASNIIQNPIVIEVEPSTYGADNSTRNTDLEYVNTTSVSGFTPSPANPGQVLIIRSKTEGKKPVFQGGLSLFGARNITLKNIKITRSVNISDHTGSAVEMGVYPNDTDANSCEPGTFANAKIELNNCEIEATGFNCIHAAGCNKLIFNGCVFNLEGSGSGDNDKYWGASVKLMSCNYVQFTRNSMKGSHATTLFLQHVQNMLIMNNVFWNDNLFTSNVAFVRPVVNTVNTQRAVQDIGIYYNTFYLADHASSAYPVDFLRFGCTESVYGAKPNAQKGGTENYKADKIHFKWNNCYSYDDKISARNENEDAFQNVTLTDGNYTSNNFWSKGDAEPNNEEANSNLRFGTSTMHINVEEQVCKSTATDPDELILKGSLLNVGYKPVSDISGLNLANNTFADRFNNTVRSEGNDWTYGAFQQANIVEVDTIIWVGGKSNNWDVRSNWVTTTGKRLNCANMFSSNLHVIIPDAEDLENVPVIPLWTDYATRGTYSEEYVAAGLGAKSFGNVTKFADSFTIEEGGALKGIENLKNGVTLRYSGAENSFTARRNEWVLVGGVIKPFVNGISGDIRNVRSGDFYIADQKPHVYMQHFTIDDKNSIKPSIPFTSLETDVPTNSAFGILIPDQYGQYKLPASSYYKYFEPNSAMVGDATVPKQYKFKGRFADEDALPTYTISAAGIANCVFVNNSYTANLNVAKLLYDNSSNLKAKVYSYTEKSWGDVTKNNTEGGAVYVKPNNGFVLYTTSGTATVTTTQSQYGNGSTIYYKSAQADTNLKLKVINTSDATASTLNVIYNDESLPKAFSYNESTPEIYVPDGADMYSTYSVDDMAKVIPLSVRNKQQSGSLTVQFKLILSEGFESVILEDRLYGKTYDLLEGEAPFFSGIAPGDCAGRFYLNINYAEEETTNVEEEANDSITGAGSIDIYRVNGNQVVISSADNVTLSQAYVTDLSGRTVVVNLLDSHYNVITLDGAQGVFIIKAVGDSASKTEKVIVK